MPTAKRNRTLRISKKTDEALDLIEDANVLPMGYHQGLFHVLSPAKNGERAYNHSFRTPYAALMRAKGYGYRKINNTWRDWYMSINTYNRYRRLETQLRTLGGFVVDADCWADTPTRNSKKTTVFMLCALYHRVLKKANLPEPTILIGSGYGLYFIWLFNHAVPCNSLKILKVWKSVENRINKAFNKACLQIFGEKLADPKAEDPVHVFRMPETFNHKGWQEIEAQVLEVNPKNRYDLTRKENQHKWIDIKPYWQVRFPAPPKTKTTNHRSNHHKRTKPKLNIHITHNIYTLYWGVVHDLYTYVKLNNHDITHRRDIFFLYFCYWSLKASGSIKAVMKYVHIVNDHLVNPLPENELEHFKREMDGEQIHSNKYGDHNILAYHFTKKRMIHTLGVTRNQYKYMHILKPSSKSHQRALAKKSTARKRNLRNRKIIKFHRRGLSARKIAKIMKIGNKTASRVIKASE